MHADRAQRIFDALSALRRAELVAVRVNDMQASFLTAAWEMVLGRFATAHTRRPRARRAPRRDATRND